MSAHKNMLRRAIVLTAFATLSFSTTRPVVAAITDGSTNPAMESPADGAHGYNANCASCHGASMQGAAGPALTGAGFAARWRGKERALYDMISKTMPLGAPGSLASMTYHAVTDYLLKQSGVVGASAVKGMADEFGAPRQPTAEATPVVTPPLPDAPKQFGTPTTSVPDDAELLHPSEGDWLRYNRDYQGQRYSPLNQITPANIAQLAPKCIFQTGEVGSFQSSPIVRAGRLYVTTAHKTYAVDATNCHKIWSYEYVAKGTVFEYMPNNRGVALYKGMVIRGTLDGHVIALDAENGKLIWDTWLADSTKGYFLSAAPVVFDGKLYMGEAGADYGAAGHLYALDAMTGRVVWTFNIIPKDGEAGRKTWPKTGERGGGSMWTTVTVDPTTRSLYASTGNPWMDFDGSDRAGDNLYTNAVIVVDADTGKLKWYVQQNPHDVRDYDTTAAPVVYTAGKRNMMAVGSKDARLYLYDRDTHKLIAKRNVSTRENAEGPLPAGKSTHICPGPLGGVEWNGPAFDPNNGLLFVNSVDWCTTLTPETPAENAPSGGITMLDPPATAHGWLHAFDAATGAERWTYHADGPMLAGLTPTASGLLLTGTTSGDFVAFEAKTGKQLYSFYTGSQVAGGISTYMVDNKQYIAVDSGNSSKLIWRNTGGPIVVIFGLP